MYINHETKEVVLHPNTYALLKEKDMLLEGYTYHFTEKIPTHPTPKRFDRTNMNRRKGRGREKRG